MVSKKIKNFYCQICCLNKSGYKEKFPELYKFHSPDVNNKKAEGSCCRDCLKITNQKNKNNQICRGIEFDNYFNYFIYDDYLIYDNKKLTEKINNNIIKSTNCIHEGSKICINCFKLKSKLNYLKKKLINYESFKFNNDDEKFF